MKTYFLFIIVSILSACSMQKTTGVSLEQALSMAEENRTELEKVLKYYKNDSLKLEAARFLIQNMPFHFSRMEYFISPKGKQYVPDLRKFTNNQAVKEHCDSLLAKGYKIKKEIVHDIKNIQADFLIRNINLAFEVWQTPWAKEVSFKDFCRYILPYRGQNEPISQLRETFMRQYKPLLDSAQIQNPLEASILINNLLSKKIRYQKTGSPLESTIEETYKSGIGTCVALCNYTTFVMRAVGIPTAIMQTTWTRMNSIHNWCAVLQDNSFYDFSPGEANTHNYANTLATVHYLQPAKVYRRNFEADFSNLPQEDDGYVTLLKNPLFTDVTNEEKLFTYTLQVPTEKSAKKKSNLVYLCTFNNQDWTPISIGTRNKQICQFTQVAGRNLLIVAEAFGKDELRYISPPFLTDGKGGIRKLEPDWKQFTTITCKRERGKQVFPLAFWDTNKKKFIRLEWNNLTDSTHYYDSIPSNALLLHTYEDKNGIWEETGLVVDGCLKRNKDL